MAKRLTTLLILLLAMDAVTAEARTWNVRKDGTGDYMVIQEAVDHAAAGDTVRIGPGRYEEKRPYTSYPPTTDKWTFEVYVAVDVSDLTLIGAGADQTIIGPPARIWQSPQQPKIICALSRVSRLVVEDLALENVCNGVYRDQGGTLTMRRCTVDGCDGGVVSWSEQGTYLEDCQFTNNANKGILAWGPAARVNIQRCLFVGSGTYLDQALDGVVSNCRFEGGTTGCTYVHASTGTVSNCTFTGIQNVAVVVGSRSIVELLDNALLSGDTNLQARDTGTVVTGSGNVLSGGSFSTIRISNSTVQMQGSHILHGAGPSVYLEGFPSAPIETMDLTNNYWGTTSADSIASWIYDGHDNPAIYGYVQFEPYSAGVIPTEKKSLGGVKRLFR